MIHGAEFVHKMKTGEGGIDKSGYETRRKEAGKLLAQYYDFATCSHDGGALFTTNALLKNGRLKKHITLHRADVDIFWESEHESDDRH